MQTLTPQKLILTQQECVSASISLVLYYRKEMATRPRVGNPSIYGVPRGGVPVAYLVAAAAGLVEGASIAESPETADLIVDDIVDSGLTRERFQKLCPSTPFLSLCEFIPERRPGTWVVFPWETAADGQDTSAEDIVTRLLQYIGEDPKREGLLETPQRYLKAWKEWTAGYHQDPAAVLKCFEDGSENYDEMVIVKDLPFYSFCEHHLAPFFGTATIAYIPDKKVVGLSKLGRVLQIFARRLQVQERMTTQIADALNSFLGPKAVGVLVKGRHLCMESRGISQQGHYTVTSALRGAFRTNPSAREEFLAIAQQP